MDFESEVKIHYYYYYYYFIIIINVIRLNATLDHGQHLQKTFAETLPLDIRSCEVLAACYEPDCPDLIEGCIMDEDRG